MFKLTVNPTLYFCESIVRLRETLLRTLNFSIKRKEKKMNDSRHSFSFLFVSACILVNRKKKNSLVMCRRQTINNKKKDVEKSKI
jgi:hypothetical protein